MNEPEPYDAQKKRQLRPAAEEALAMVRPILEAQQPVDDELLTDAFYEWLEAHGVILEKYHLSKGGFEAIIDLNKLQPAMLAYADRRADKRAEEARIDAIVHIMGAKTEGLFDNGELFIKRAPIEQAVVDLIGYEKFKAIQDSLPATHHPKGENQ